VYYGSLKGNILLKHEISSLREGKGKHSKREIMERI